MLEQKLRNRQPTPLAGAGIVALAALAAIAGSAFFTRLQPHIGIMASVGFIAYGCAIAWALLNWYALTFVYTANADCLRVCRAYGKRERFMVDVWLNRVLAYGAPEDVKRRYPDARVYRATRSECAFEPLALAYRDSDRTAILVLQPDDAMRAFLLEHVSGKAKG